MIELPDVPPSQRGHAFQNLLYSLIWYVHALVLFGIVRLDVKGGHFGRLDAVSRLLSVYWGRIMNCQNRRVGQGASAGGPLC